MGDEEDEQEIMFKKKFLADFMTYLNFYTFKGALFC